MLRFPGRGSPSSRWPRWEAGWRPRAEPARQVVARPLLPELLAASRRSLPRPFGAALVLWPAETGSEREDSFRSGLRARPKAKVRRPTSQQILVGVGVNALVCHSSSSTMVASADALQSAVELR